MANAVTQTMFELVDEVGETAILEGLHDALVGHARLSAELHPVRPAARARGDEDYAGARHAIARQRYVAHRITLALDAIRDFDRRYPR